MIDYEILKLIWWLFVGVLLVGFAVMDGQDMGVGSLLPFLGKNDTERRVMINTVAPHWDGNQVWLLTGGGAIFAAWPLFIVLAALILRPVAFDYRSRVPAEKWRSSWDWALFIGSFVPPIIFGVAFCNIIPVGPQHNYLNQTNTKNRPKSGQLNTKVRHRFNCHDYFPRRQLPPSSHHGRASGQSPKSGNDCRRSHCCLIFVGRHLGLFRHSGLCGKRH